MTTQIKLQKQGYEPFFDFLKAYAIICVLAGHTLPLLHYVGAPLWINLQVPIFVLIQSFHVLKKDNPKFSFKKIWYRILLPYLIVQIVAFTVLLIQNGDCNTLIINTLTGGYRTRFLLPMDFYSNSFVAPILEKTL